MPINRRNNLIKYGLGILLSVIIIFGIIIASGQSNKITSRVKYNLKAEVEQQVSVPEGYNGIYTADDLKNIENDLTANYILMANINMSGIDWTPLGLNNTAFTGIFDGNLYKISNLNIKSESTMVGLFRRVNGGTIKNLTLENVTVTNINPSNNGSARTAGLVGYVDTATIENVKIIGESIIEDNSLSSYNSIGGLVGYVYSSITIRNSSVEANIKVNGNSNIYVGGLVGQIYAAGTIENSYSTGEIIAETTTALYVGGIVGSGTTANISDSYSSSKITATAVTTIYAGGIVGSSTYGTIENTYYKGNITVSNGVVVVGGLIGHMIHGSLYSSYNMGDIITNTTNNETVGGVIGSVNNTTTSGTTSTSTNVNINKIYSSGNIKIESTEETTKYKYIGGLIGIIYNGSTSKNYNINIDQAYATGSIDSKIVSTAETNNVYITGLIGYSNLYKASEASNNNNINIDETYSTVKINIVDGQPAGIIAYAGVSDYYYGDNSYYNRTNVTNSYWSPEATTQDYSVGGNPKLLQSMLYKDTYAGWDFDTTWAIEEGETLPYFKDLEKPQKVNKTEYEFIIYEGEGTEENPYLIRTPEELQGMKNDLEKHYKLANNIEWDIMNLFEPIGNSQYTFKGSLDGNNYKISNLRIESENNFVGLFGNINGATIKNLTLENETIRNTYASNISNERIGGLVGYISAGTIDNVNITGESIIEENSKSTYTSLVGGLVGYASLNTTIKDSNSTANISANTTSNNINIGGLIGSLNQTTIENSYSTGNIIAISESGEINAGGLIGYANESTITSCYSTGSVIVQTDGGCNAGGLIGETDTGTIITTSRAIGDITATSSSGYINSGGLTGINYGGTQISKSYSVGDLNATTTTGRIYSGGIAGYSAGEVINAYTTGKVTSTSTSGEICSAGLIGYNNGTITNTYAIGKVKAETTGTTNLGGLVGYSASGTTTNSYWSEKSTGQEASAKGTSKTIQELLYQDAYENWDFDTIWTIEPNGESLAYLKELERPDSVLKDEVIYETKITVLKTDTNGKPLSGASFIVKNEAGETVREGQSKENGKYIIGDLEAGVYTLIETNPPTSYIKDNTEYRFYFAEDGKIYNIETEMEIGNLVIQNEELQIEVLNRDIETKEPIKGSVIGLFDEEGNAIIGTNGAEVKGTTDENGKVIFTKIIPGTYKYKQISVATGYKINPTIYTVTITEDGTVTFVEGNNGIIENEKIRLNATITKKDYETDEPLQDVKIGLYDANKAQILDEEGNHIVKITNEEGQVTFENLEVGTYYYKEMEALEGYVLDSTMYKLTVNQDETITYFSNNGVIYNKVKTGTILIRKRVYDSSLKISGVVFGLYYEDGSKVLDENGNHRKAVTNKYGYAIFTGLEKGTYKYRELYTPGRYYIYTRMLTAIVNDDYSVTFVEGNNGIVYNKRINYSVSFGGLGYYSGKNVIIYDSEGREVSRQTVGKNGKVTFTDLESGNYYYTVEGEDTRYSFGINEDGSITSTGTGPATIYTAGNPVDVTVRHPSGTSGAIIRLYDSEGNLMYDANGDPIYGTTNENGEVIFTGLLPGTYIYKIDGDDTEYTFTVREDGKISYNGGSYDTPANVVITTYVSGIIIGLYYEDGTPVTDGSGKHITGTTGSDGTVIFSGIYTGDYYYKQEEVPEGYIKNENTYNFTVDEDGNVTYGDNNGIMTNERVTTGVTVNKVWLDNNNSAGKRPTGLVLKVMNGDEEVGRKTVNEENNWSHTFNLYKYTENSEIINYTVDEEEINIGDLKFYTSTIDGNTITNTFTVPDEKVSYTINKVWVDTLEQSVHRPASIKVQILNGNEVVQEQEISNTQTEVTFSDLPKYDSNGNEIAYTVAEAEVNVGDLKYYTSTIDGNTITNTYNGPKITANVGVLKYETGTTTVVEGAIIGLFNEQGTAIRDNDGNQIKYETKEDGLAIFLNLEPGIYKYKELQAPEGYILNDTMYEFTINDEGKVSFGYNNGIIYNDKVVIEQVKGNVTILKLEKDTQRILSGATIGLFNEQGESITKDGQEVELVTNEEGKVTFEDLLPGTYIYKEIQAPEGYKLESKEYKFIIDEEGKVSFIENSGVIYNEKIKEEIKEPEENDEIKNDGTNNNQIEELPSFLPQTGEKITNMVLIFITIIIAVYYGIKSRKNK